MAERAQTVCFLSITVVVLAALSTSSAQTPSKASDQTNLTYTVSRILLEYGPRGSAPHRELPPVEEFLTVPVELGQNGDNYLAPTPGEHSVRLTLGKVQQIRVVVLNACFSRPQAEAITEVIDCAIGMRRAIGDEAAIAFAASFYRAIGFGRSVQEAFDQGKTALMLEGIPNVDTPELLLRPGTDAKSLILIDPRD